MSTYHATPYDISATGFYFQTYDEYREKAARHCNAYGQLVEEYEIQFIDGDHYALFDALKINQATLRQWFECFEEMGEEEAVKAIYLAEYLGYGPEEITEQALDEVYLFQGNAQEFAEHYIDETGMLADVPDNLRFYFDYESFARDLVYSGDISEVDIKGVTYVLENH